MDSPSPVKDNKRASIFSTLSKQQVMNSNGIFNYQTGKYEN